MGEDGYDTIVVGGGTAGIVLAARLSEDAAHRVLLVEAGGSNRNPLYRIPLGIGKLRTARGGLWRHTTEPEPHLDGRALALGTGKVLGGSASINGMIHMTPPAADLDRWESLGAAGWNAPSLAPAFARLDAMLAPRRAAATHPLDRAFLAACAGAGIARDDALDAPHGEAAGALLFNIREGRRHSVAQAYLRPALARPNLTVMTNAEVLRIVAERGAATGIELADAGGGPTRRLRAAHGIAIAAGALQSPKLLMLSGIGAADALRAHGIAPLIDLPGVGGNLQNHVDVALRHACEEPVTLHSLLRAERILPAMTRAWLFGTGPATRFPGDAAAFIRTVPGERLPDVLCHLVEGLGIRGIRWPLMRGPVDALDREGFSCRVMLLRPESRGRVALRSADPRDPPRVRFDYLSRASELRRLVDGVRRMRDVFARPEFAGLRGAELEPGPAAQDDGALAAWIRARADMQCHPVGTCAMGVGADAVVDPQLRVRGLDRLRVVDAAVMPAIVGVNTFATTVAIAERAAELMR
ncbi:MAG: GMC family oxidoreductase N-terminal domain-containing protein [Alphaproteobacteria bacterium]|nr:GMC family oxidoreductase N-terminal domain-containing protein [Alphaproteobacteria bacterium]